MTTYRCLNSGSIVNSNDEHVVWMNIYDVSNCVSSWEDGTEPTTYTNSINVRSVYDCNISIHTSQLHDGFHPFVMSDGVYWELEQIS